jgi:enoyl-CoA hydratase
VGQPEIRIGIIPGAGGTQVLPRLIGEKRAKDLVFTGRTITASEALQMGLVNQVVPQEKLKESTENFIAVLLRRSPVTLRIAKLAVNRALETTLSVGLECEKDFFALCFGTEDQKEGARAFLEKREPEYKGR